MKRAKANAAKATESSARWDWLARVVIRRPLVVELDQASEMRLRVYVDRLNRRLEHAEQSELLLDPDSDRDLASALLQAAEGGIEADGELSRWSASRFPLRRCARVRVVWKAGSQTSAQAGTGSGSWSGPGRVGSGSGSRSGRTGSGCRAGSMRIGLLVVLVAAHRGPELKLVLTPGPPLSAPPKPPTAAYRPHQHDRPASPSAHAGAVAVGRRPVPKHPCPHLLVQHNPLPVAGPTHHASYAPDAAATGTRCHVVIAAFEHQGPEGAWVIMHHTIIGLRQEVMHHQLHRPVRTPMTTPRHQREAVQ